MEFARSSAQGERRLNATGADAFFHIPEIFCWTKMGTEAGQSLGAILHRKELERSTGGGTFAWGIGNSLGDAPEIARKMTASGDVDVLFTPMKSAPKAVDATPSSLFLWMFYQKQSGESALLPEHMLVTSRGSADKRVHYALICKSERSLEESEEVRHFEPAGVRNLVSMNPVGASQVTSVVRYTGATATMEKAYRVAFSAKLHAEGFVRLVEPVPLTGELFKLYTDLCNVATDGAWKTGVRKLKDAAMAFRCELNLQGELALV